MKVMLSNAPSTKDASWEFRRSSLSGPSTGIVYLASMLGPQKALGFDKKAADAILLEPNQKGSDERIGAFGPDVFGATAYEFNLMEVGDLFAQVRAINPSTICAVGGPAATLVPNHVLRATGADILFQGEAEIPWRSFIEHLDSCGKLEDFSQPGVHIKGLGATSGTRVVPRLTLEQFQSIEPDISLIEGFGSDPGIRPVDFAFSRGCPNQRCSFCQISPFQEHRRLGLEKTMRIIRDISGIPRANMLAFGDGTFGGGKDGAKELLRRIISSGISFDQGMFGEFTVEMCLGGKQAGMRKADEELLSLMHEAGMRCFELGIESFSMVQLKKFSKPLFNLTEFLNLMDAVGRMGMEAGGSFHLMGFDTVCEDVLESIEKYFRMKLVRPDLCFGIGIAILPYVGTGEYKKFLDIMSRDPSSAMLAHSLMKDHGFMADISDDGDGYPYLFKTALPLLDIPLLKAVCDPAYLMAISTMDLDEEQAKALRLVMLTMAIHRSIGSEPESRRRFLNLMVENTIDAALQTDIGSTALITAERAAI